MVLLCFVVLLTHRFYSGQTEFRSSELRPSFRGKTGLSSVGRAPQWHGWEISPFVPTRADFVFIDKIQEVACSLVATSAPKKVRRWIKSVDKGRAPQWFNSARAGSTTAEDPAAPLR